MFYSLNAGKTTPLLKVDRSTECYGVQPTQTEILYTVSSGVAD